MIKRVWVAKNPFSDELVIKPSEPQYGEHFDAGLGFEDVIAYVDYKPAMLIMEDGEDE